MILGTLGAYAWLAINYTGATSGGYVVLIRDLIRIFQKRWRDGNCRKFLYRECRWQHQESCSSQEFDWVAGRIWAGRVAELELPFFPISPLRLQAVMTMLSLNNQNSNLSDLRGKTIGVFLWKHSRRLCA